MTDISTGRRDEFGFLTPRVAKDAQPILWTAVLMVATWVGACSLSLAMAFGAFG